MTTRVYHPTLNAWSDIRDGDVDAWTESGWETEAGDHIDDADALPVPASPEALAAAEGVELPGDAPTEAWTHEQLDAYAARRGVEVTGTKAEKITALGA